MEIILGNPRKEGLGTLKLPPLPPSSTLFALSLFGSIIKTELSKKRVPSYLRLLRNLVVRRDLRI